MMPRVETPIDLCNKGVDRYIEKSIPRTVTKTFKTDCILLVIVVAFLVATSGTRLVAQNEVPDSGFVATDSATKVPGCNNQSISSLQFADLALPNVIPAGQSFDLLSDFRIQNELGLTAEQTNQLRELRNNMENELVSQMKKDSDPSMRSGIQLSNIRIRVISDFEKNADEILLPPQLKRLQEIAVQNRLRTKGLLGTLVSRDVSASLNIEPDQRQELRKRSAEIEKEMQNKIKALKLEAEQELLSSLSSDQQRSFKRIVGEPFQLKKRNAADPADQ